MSNSIDQRLKRLRARAQWEREHPPNKPYIEDWQMQRTPFSQREALAKQAAKRAEGDARWEARAQRTADRQARADAAQARWHKRFFVRTGSWHPDAYIYVVKTKRLESRLRYERKRRTTPDGA